MIDDTIFADYHATRAPTIDRSVLCHAPFTSLNFDQHGYARVCCYNWRARLGSWPESTLSEIWAGAEAVALRRSFIDGTDAKGCDLCFDQLRARNFHGALMRNFDHLSQVAGYRPELRPHAPRVIEFELSNTCNLECVQCQATWSSSIRHNRDHLPPMANPYDERFVEQLEPFLPTLVEAKFLGGEPMLIRLYHVIWERIRAINPNIVLSLTTNGTVLPERPFATLSGLRSHVCLSIDSLDAESFARIRHRASLPVVLANFERWREYTRARGTSLSVPVCPMTYNWRELPEFLAFATRHDVPLVFNTVVRPWAASLAGLPTGELDGVIAHLAEHQPGAGTPRDAANASAWAGMIGQLRSWRDTRHALDQRFPGFISTVRLAARSHAALLDRNGAGTAEAAADAVARLLAASWLDRARVAAEQQAYMVQEQDGDLDALVAAAGERLAGASWLRDDPAARELADNLYQMTPVTVHVGEQPVDQILLLRVLVLFRNMGLLVAGGPVVPAPVRTERLAADLDAVERLIKERGDAVDWRMMWETLPNGSVRVSCHLLSDWLKQLLHLAQPDYLGT